MYCIICIRWHVDIFKIDFIAATFVRVHKKNCRAHSELMLASFFSSLVCDDNCSPGLMLRERSCLCPCVIARRKVITKDFMILRVRVNCDAQNRIASKQDTLLCSEIKLELPTMFGEEKMRIFSSKLESTWNPLGH